EAAAAGGGERGARALGPRGVARIEQLHAVQARVGAARGGARLGRIADHGDAGQSLARKPRRRAHHARIAGLGEYQPARRRGGEPADALQRAAHRRLAPSLARAGAKRARRRRSTSSGTSPWTRPPCRATSFTRVEFRYVNSWLGIRNAISTPGANLRFMSAIWNSNSKSLTARRPRMMTWAPMRRAQSTSRTVNWIADAPGRPSLAHSIISIRSSGVNRLDLTGFCATAITTRSNRAVARRARSRWPLVNGSKLPGNKATRGFLMIP